MDDNEFKRIIDNYTVWFFEKWAASFFWDDTELEKLKNNKLERRDKFQGPFLRNLDIFEDIATKEGLNGRKTLFFMAGLLKAASKMVDMEEVREHFSPFKNDHVLDRFSRDAETLSDKICQIAITSADMERAEAISAIQALRERRTRKTGAQKSAKIRKTEREPRNKAMVEKAREMLDKGNKPHLIVGIIAGTPLARTPDGKKLSEKQIRNILQENGILPKRKKKGK